MFSSCGFQDMSPTDQNTFPQQHWNVATFHGKFPNFSHQLIHNLVLCFAKNKNTEVPLNGLRKSLNLSQI